MSSNLTRSALAMALAATVLGMAGCGGAKQAAGGTGGPPPAPSTALAGNEKPGAAAAPVQAGDATTATTGTATAPPVAKLDATTGVKSEAKAQPGGESQPAASAGVPVKPQAPAPASAPASAPAPASVPASAPAPAPASAPGPKSGDPTPLKFAELYSGASIERGLQISDKTQALNGRRVRMTGYMAPPLKPSLDFFVLTKQPMSICPFCSTDADWPNDIILVLVKEKAEAVVPTTPVQVTGVLEVGGKQDPQTGFYSVIRIYADSVKEVK